MITCHQKHLVARCKERGYSLADVMPCVVKQTGDLWVIDETHPSYPHPRVPLEPECLAGAELKKLLRMVGITATPNCTCNSRAAHMDMMGCQWVKDNLDTVVGWLEEEAGERGLPFVRAAGAALVNLAVRRAEAKSRGSVSI